MRYILYKNPVQTETLEIVQYLYYIGKTDVLPSWCIERNYPIWVKQLPAIETDNGQKYVGLQECIKFYENQYNMPNVVFKSHNFKVSCPDYRIHP